MLTSHQKEKVLQLLHIQQKSPFLNCCSYTSTPKILLKISEIRALPPHKFHIPKKNSVYCCCYSTRENFRAPHKNLTPNEWLFSCIYTTFSINYFEPTCHKLSLFLIIIILNIAGPTCHKISFYFYFVKKLHLWSRLLTINNLLFCFYLNLNFIYSML